MQIDLDGTVGPFTTIWPLVIQSNGLDIFDVIRQVKDKRRSAPSNGWAHFASSLHPEAPKSSGPDTVKEVTFNFIEPYQQLERPDSMFQLGDRPKSRVSDVSDALGRSSVIEVVADLRDARLHFRFYFHKHAAVRRPIKKWINNCERTLADIAQRLPASPSVYTLADFPLMPFTYDTLNFFMDSMAQFGIAPENVQDVYPCSPIQRGILLSQAKEAQYYQTFLIWKVHDSRNSMQVSTDRVASAWRKLVARHSILRTVFINGVVQDNFVDQVVLKEVSLEIDILGTDEETGLLSTLSSRRQLAVAHGKLPHRLAIGQTLAGDVLCGLEISHALFDGTTKQNMLEEFRLAYEGSLSSAPGPVYHDYISYLGSQSAAAQQRHWRKYLDGVAPCQLPGNAGKENGTKDILQSALQIDVGDASILRQFCEANEVTLSNVFQVAWGCVLKSFTNSDAVCFGYISAGRDVPVRHAQRIMGPLINMLVCRMDLSDTRSLKSILQENQNSFVECLKHQHYPLTDILRAAQVSGGGSLFNTVMSLQKVGHAAGEEKPLLQVDVIDGEDPTEVMLLAIFPIMQEY